MHVPRIFRVLFLAVAVGAVPATSFADVSISVNIGPPALPVYEQPPCPAEGYIWTPGYWAWGPEGYYWVPGTWVMAPQPGFLWTPGYWGWSSGVYLWHTGYWGPHVGYYGGVNYGYGYGGMGYGGGRWEGNHFAYNTVVNNVNVTNVHNVYVDKTVIVNNNNYNRVSYNGGPGGVQARPTPMELRAEQEHHLAPPAAQVQHEMAARADRNQWASVNHGRPAVVAAPRPLAEGRPVAAQVNNVRPMAPANTGARPLVTAHPNTPQPMAQPNNNIRQQAPVARANNGQFESRPTYQQNARPQAAPQPQYRPQPAAPVQRQEAQRQEVQRQQQMRQAPVQRQEQYRQPPVQRAEPMRQAPAPRPEPHAAPAPQHQERPNGGGQEHRPQR